MFKNETVFARASENERRFRMMICFLGLAVVLYTAVSFSADILSLEQVESFIIRSGFMTNALPEKILGFTE